MSFSIINANDSTYTNPVLELNGDIADPSVLKYDGKYYLYATNILSHTYGYKVYESTDLVHWEDKGDAFNKNISGNSWGKENFWAPEVVEYNGSFYMIYSARAEDGILKIAIAKSSDPLGPFINVKAPLFENDLECIDGHLFIDDDKSVYVFYTKDCSSHKVNGYPTSESYVRSINLNYMAMGTECLVATPYQEWEKQSSNPIWNEGPHVIKHNDIYYLMYSGNAFFLPSYGLGCATATSPLGPYTKYESNPVLHQNPEIGATGTGHHCIVESPDGTELFVVYHIHKDSNNPHGGRAISIDRIHFDSNDSLIVDGPTKSPQPMPSSNNTSIDKINNELIPEEIKINKIYPNPFNGNSKIKFDITKEAFINIQIFDSRGNIVKSLHKGKKMPGQYETEWNGKNDNNKKVHSGIYFCSISNNRHINTQKMIYLK